MREAVRILVTGITGRIGANLAEDLRNQGHQIHGLMWDKDERVADLKALDVELHHGTFTDEEYFEINVRGTFNMHGPARVPRGSVGASATSSTPPPTPYMGGHQVDQPGDKSINEDDAPRRPATWHAPSKHFAQEACHGLHRIHSTPFLPRHHDVLRLGTLHRCHPETKLFLPQSAGEALPEAGGVIGRRRAARVAQGAGGQVLSGTYGRCPRPRSWPGLLLDKPEAYGQVFNLAVPSAFSWEEVVPHPSQALEIPWIESTLSAPLIYYPTGNLQGPEDHLAQATVRHNPYDQRRLGSPTG